MLTTVSAFLALIALVVFVGHTVIKRLKRLALARWVDGEGRQALAEHTLLASAHAEAHEQGFGRAFDDEIERLGNEHGRLIRIGHVIAAYRNARATGNSTAS